MDRNKLDTKYPNMSVEEIVEFLGHSLELIESENGRRRATYEAWANEQIDVGGVELVPGEWYDVVPGGGYQPGRAWRVCRYIGRERRENYGNLYESFVFERWGAKAATDPYARPHGPERVGLHATNFAVTKIEPDPRVLAKQEARGRVRA